MTGSQRLDVNTPILKLEDVHGKVEVVHGFLLSHCLGFTLVIQRQQVLPLAAVRHRPIHGEGVSGF